MRGLVVLLCGGSQLTQLALKERYWGGGGGGGGGGLAPVCGTCSDHLRSEG